VNTNDSISFIPRLSPRMHVLERRDRIALGRTYNAISPLLLSFSIQMLLPHANEPAMIPPYGPSQKSCEIQGNRRAKTMERVRQTPYQHDETNVERNAALRRAWRIVGRTIRRRSMIELGRVRKIGRKWTWDKYQKYVLATQSNRNLREDIKPLLPQMQEQT